MKKGILRATREVGKAVNIDNLSNILNTDRKSNHKVFVELKKEGAIVSPIHRTW